MNPQLSLFGRIARFFCGLSTNLQMLTIMISAVGIAFGVKSYHHVKDAFGEEASQVFLNDLWQQIGIAAVINIIVGLIIYQIATKRVVTLCEVMRSLTEGDYSVEVPYTKKTTEIGSMARKVQIFKENGMKLNKMEEDRKQAEIRSQDD
jgi:signal transduction histidine kinase